MIDQGTSDHIPVSYRLAHIAVLSCDHARSGPTTPTRPPRLPPAVRRALGGRASFRLLAPDALEEPEQDLHGEGTLRLGDRPRTRDSRLSSYLAHAFPLLALAPFGRGVGVPDAPGPWALPSLPEDSDRASAGRRIGSGDWAPGCRGWEGSARSSRPSSRAPGAHDARAIRRERPRCSLPAPPLGLAQLRVADQFSLPPFKRSLAAFLNSRSITGRRRSLK
jgi:hypothetical protein